MADKEQFDEFLGGSQSLPHEVPVMDFVTARLQEISALTHVLENPKQNKLVFQKLPVYMRRRVMSHNVKRLPRRLREAHLAQMRKSTNDTNVPSTNKRPCRKYRRRPTHLLSEYSRRQRDKIWLETHIWHAKRFHMIDKWGYRLPNYSNDKCFRANYRAVTQDCLLQDISYYTCVEITGEENILKTTLGMHCDPATSFPVKYYIEGRREGTLLFFKKNGHPHSPIGHVHFMWKPSEVERRTIWIWVHPSFYDEFLAEITSSFEFKLVNAEHDTTHVINNDLYTNVEDCKMMILRYTLNRFRLHGPELLSVLTEALHLPSLTESGFRSEMDCAATKDQDSTATSVDKNVLQSVEEMAINEGDSKDSRKIDDEVVSKGDLNAQESRDKKWHVKYYENQENMEAFKTQQQMWETLQSLASKNLAPSERDETTFDMIMGITVLDPRFHLPDKRTKSEKDEAERNVTSLNYTVVNRLPNMNRSPIWDAAIRRTVSESCMSTNEINELRSKCVVPGVSNDRYFDESIMAKIPILLIQKESGGSITGLGSCMDIIIPSRWALPFWLALVMRGARVGALRESKSIAFESVCSIPSMPDINEPDSLAYAEEAASTRGELTRKYFSYPPNKRTNFTKFGITSPFYCDWKILTNDWSSVNDFYILRDLELLVFLQNSICPKKYRRNTSDQDAESNFENLGNYQNCLIRVHVSMLGKGVAREFAIICMPTSEDLEKHKSNKNSEGPRERCHVDPNEESRKELRKNHLATLKRLRRERMRRKKLQDTIKELPQESRSELLDNCAERINKSDSLHSNAVVFSQREKMSELFLPDCTKVRYSCDREVMGYLTMGDYSFRQAKGIGIGYVTVPSLIVLARKKSNIVLLRDTHTQQYRLAKLEIVEACKK